MEALFMHKPKVPMDVNALRLAINNIATRYAEVKDTHPEHHHF